MKRDLTYFTDHHRDGSNLRIAEHETLMSFNNDGGNYAFNDWWIDEGFDLYSEWCNSNLEKLSELYG